MKNVMITGVLALTASFAQAASAPASSHWTGSGHSYDLSGKETDSYTLDVQVAAGDDSGVETVTVQIGGSGGRTETLVCQQTTAGKGWTKTCSDGGKGSGTLFDYGLGEDYYVGADGTAYSTQIILDGADRMRLERVTLKNGQAVRFNAETLTKAAQ